MTEPAPTDNAETGTPPTITYGGVQDRPGDVNHPDNLGVTPNSTDPAAVAVTPNTAPPSDFVYDPGTDTYTRVAPVTEPYDTHH